MGDEVGGYAIAFGLVLLCWLAGLARCVELLIKRK